MSENRRTILEMLAAGQITADEAERLLAAVEKQPSPENTEVKSKAKYLHVVVHDSDDSDVNIRVPMQLIRAGVKLASLVPSSARRHVDHALQARGVAVDLSQIKPEKLEEIIDHLDDLAVDVHDADGAKVRIFCE